MQFLYADDDFYHFMDVETYDQIDLTKDNVGDALKFVKENEMCKVCSHKGNVFAVEPPLFVELQITDTMPTAFVCDCSKEKVSNALATISRKDMQDIINDGESIEVKCQFCNKAYNFDVDELKEIIKQ